MVNSGAPGQRRMVVIFDQITTVLNQLKNDPDSRRIIVSAWNVGELDKNGAGTVPCILPVYVADGKLSCQLYQRSCDVFLGLPFNIASYALLVHMMAQQCDLEVGDFVWTRWRHASVQQPYGSNSSAIKPRTASAAEVDYQT